MKVPAKAAPLDFVSIVPSTIEKQPYKFGVSAIYPAQRFPYRTFLVLIVGVLCCQCGLKLPSPLPRLLQCDLQEGNPLAVFSLRSCFQLRRGFQPEYKEHNACQNDPSTDRDDGYLHDRPPSTPCLPYRPQERSDRGAKNRNRNSWKGPEGTRFRNSVAEPSCAIGHRIAPILAPLDLWEGALLGFGFPSGFSALGCNLNPLLWR